ncbi:MAG TPA: hypothetical protein VL947_13270, partial [Cytophagales bacterium]|nr:hypothetical protein [Cytophagales bacterium]
MIKHFLFTSILLGAILCQGQSGLDVTFGNNGIKELVSPASSNFMLTSVKSDVYGNLFACGTSGTAANNIQVVAKTKANGELDIDFGNMGYKTIDLGPYSFTSDLLLLPHGKLLLVANYAGSSKVGYRPIVRRLDAHGNVDSLFNPYVPLPFLRSEVQIRSAALTPRGQYLLAGYGIRE